MINKNPICDRLLELRGDLSNKAFAEKLKISQSTLFYYLKGRIPPSDFINHVCDLLNINPAWLLTGDGPRDKSVRGSDKSYLTADGVLYNNVSEDEGLVLAEPDGPPYGQPPELGRLKAQLERVYKGKDKAAVERLKGFLSALDPGDK